ncbi:glucose-6-phosphate isomerase [Phytohabitans kaempferiae]|uniref:Glucose-6-phosphate isomerase n=1 Tax=Phytohabitans kaempferiae TaxID=1620943 RepID=A0ABV6LWX3_9ACTN
MREVEAAAGLAVWGADAVGAAARAALVKDGVPGLLVRKDPTLWGPDAEAEARIRLGWIDTHRRSRQLLPLLAELKEELADLDRVVLAGMGGSAFAAEVITRTLGRPLTVLDTTDPGQIGRAISDRLERTVVVVSSKSGTTIETDSVRRAYLGAFLDAGLTPAEAGRHFVIVTDPGSPLEEVAREMGATVVLADPEVGGRYAALTAFGLVPAALAGVDVAELLDQAEELLPTLALGGDNPALALGAALGAATSSGKDKIALVPDGTGIVGLDEWAEQLLAESTGKEGTGMLPVVLESPGAPVDGADVLTVTLGGSLPAGAVPGGGVLPDVAVNGPLGAQFLTWEFATALAGRVIGVDPLSLPSKSDSKDNAAQILASGPPVEQPSFVEGAIEVYGTGTSTLAGALSAVLLDARPTGYLAVMAYLDRHADAALAGVRPLLAAMARRPVTFGWGPRFLHSTSLYHKDGPPLGAFLQITGAVAADLAVPGRPYTFGQLQAAQAAGDRQALVRRGRPVIRLHLTDRASGIVQLLDAARSLGN